MKWKQGCLMIAALGMAVGLVGCKGTSGSTSETKAEDSSDSVIDFEQMYFEEPEQAVAYYMNCISEQNYIKAINGANVVPSAEKIDVQLMIEAYDIYTANMFLPNTPEYKAMNIATRYGEQAEKLTYFLKTLLADGDSTEALNVSRVYDSSAKEIYDRLQADRLKTFKLLRLEPIDMKVFLDSDEKYSDYEKMLEIRNQINGYTDYREFFALYQLEGETYGGGVTCTKFEEGWVMESFSLIHGGIAEFELTPMTEAKFEAQLVK